ncbi:MAG TPA: GNAT family N-acetyltransferase [Anaeromyxobacteraceae bacterium]|nr:GNAT family N-acetyltransferase [Anaeromyxobacteraceae bacterium]
MTLPPSTPGGGLAIRAAAGADLDAMVRLLAVLFSLEADYRPDAERQRRGLALLLAEPDARVLVAEAGGRAVGMATVQLVVSTAEGAFSALVEDVVVEAAWRGRGAGQSLLSAAEAWARERGATRLQLLADRENAPALRFYERNGWRTTQLVCWRRGGA